MSAELPVTVPLDPSVSSPQSVRPVVVVCGVSPSPGLVVQGQSQYGVGGAGEWDTTGPGAAACRSYLRSTNKDLI